MAKDIRVWNVVMHSQRRRWPTGYEEQEEQHHDHRDAEAQTERVDGAVIRDLNKVDGAGHQGLDKLTIVSLREASIPE